MIFSRRKHWQFLEDELKAETEEFKKTYMTTAISLLKNSNEMYVGQFITFKEGQMLVKFSHSRILPRKGQFLVCMVLPPKLQDYRNWGDNTYRDLYKVRYNSTECVCVEVSPTREPNYSWVIFSKVSLDFADYIKNTPGIVLTFAPQRPPIDYSLNLQRIIKDSTSQGASFILDKNYHSKEWDPVLIKQDNVSSFVYTQLQMNDTMILEGPPGTGKTHMIAELCARLCAEGKSVLVTALTNRALMEIAEKPAMEVFLKDRKVLKTNVTLDEARELQNLELIKTIAPMPGCLVLSTFYITSAFAADLSIEQPFDYVIMDEASQAVLAMFAASRKIGKKNLWVGDTKQLSPIVILNDSIIKREGYTPLVNGLQLLSTSSTSPIYQLTKTYRFGKRTAQYTGLFYNNSLIAAESKEFHDIPSMCKVLCKDGGPTLILTDMPSGDNTPQFAIIMTSFIISNILNDNQSKEIAVLTCMKKTVGAIQLAIARTVGTRKNLIVDTVARVQGLTTEITVFFVPDYSYIRTLEQHLFNVATSRSKEHTIIIADRYVLDCPTLSPKVRKYIETLKRERCIYVPYPDHGLGKATNSLNCQKYIGSNLLTES